MTYLDYLKTVAKSATPGEWEINYAECGSEYGEYTVYGILDVATANWADDNAPAFAYCEGMELKDATYISTFDPPAVLDLIQRIEELEATLQRVRDARSNHPEIPECDRYTDDDVIVCGWKSAVQSIDQALEGDQK